MTVPVRGATAPEMMSFQGKYTGHQGAYFCPSVEKHSNFWWVAALEKESCRVLFAFHQGEDLRLNREKEDVNYKCFKPDKLIVPMEYLT